jgi:uncharacterized protein YcaQ
VSSISLTIPQARRLAVVGQWLPTPKGTTILDVVNHVGYLQLDPTNSIARNHLLVLWSRLGNYDEAELERLRWEDRELYEYSAAIVPVADHGIHETSMRRYPNAYSGKLPDWVNGWMRDNSALRRSIVSQLRRSGPVPSRELKFAADRAWESTGWTNERNVSRMLDFLHAKGKVVVAGRSGQQRLWDLGDRWLPRGERKLTLAEAELRVVERSAHNLGVATAKEIQREFFPGGPWPGAQKAIKSLVREGRLVPVTVDGLPGERFAHAELLKPPPRRSHTTFLSPFDPLIRNRERTEALWDFHYRIEIYVPKAKRQYGYFVLPILHGDELVGRIDPVVDRKAGVLHVNNVWWEPGRREIPLDRPLRSLAKFVGADSITT